MFGKYILTHYICIICNVFGYKKNKKNKKNVLYRHHKKEMRSLNRKSTKMFFTSISISLLAFIYLGRGYFSQTKRKHQF